MAGSSCMYVVWNRAGKDVVTSYTQDDSGREAIVN